MKNKLQVLIAIAMFFAASQAFAQRGRVVGRWVANTSNSCVDTCDRGALQPLSTGIVQPTQYGDPNLYLCKAVIPGQASLGARAGYNWNGSIGSNSQPGCTIVGGGRNGYSHVASFHCFCESGIGIVDGGRQ